MDGITGTNACMDTYCSIALIPSTSDSSSISLSPFITCRVGYTETRTKLGLINANDDNINRNDKWKNPGQYGVEQNFGCGHLFGGQSS